MVSFNEITSVVFSLLNIERMRQNEYESHYIDKSQQYTKIYSNQY